MALVHEELVSFEVAKLAANNPNDFDLKMNVFGTATPQTSAGMGGGDDGIEVFGD